jgi:hypothetical protein
MDPYNSRLPAPAVPVVDPASGYLTPVWFSWFQSMFARLGGSDTTTSQVLADLVAGSTLPAIPVVIGPSPFVYTAPRAGFVLVSGGGVTKLEITANGTTFFPTGSWYGAFPVAKKSQARLTYIGTPSVTFIPR